MGKGIELISRANSESKHPFPIPFNKSFKIKHIERDALNTIKMTEKQI